MKSQQVITFEVGKHNLQGLVGVEQAILKGKQVTIECSKNMKPNIENLLNFILDRKLEGDRQAQRAIVLKKLFNNEPPRVNIVINENIQPKHTKSKPLTPQMSPNFHILRLHSNHWLFRLGNTKILLNPSITSPIHNMSKIIMSSCTLDHAIALWTTVKQLHNPIPIVTTYQIYEQLTIQLHFLTGLQIPFLKMVMPLELIKPGQVLTLCHGAKIKLTYLAYYVPSVSVNIFYADRSLLVMGDIYHHPRQFYYAWKEKRLSEERYYQLVNMTLMDTLTILLKQSFSQQFLDKNKAKILKQRDQFCTCLVSSVNVVQTTTINRIATISRIALLQPLLTTKQIMNLLQQSSQQSFYQGQIIVKQAMRSEKIYIIVSGSVNLHNQASTINKNLSVSDMICQDMINRSNICGYTATCLSNTIVLSVNRHCFLFIIRQDSINKALNIRNTDISHLASSVLSQCHPDVLRWLVYQSEIVSEVTDRYPLYLDMESGKLVINQMYFYGKEKKNGGGKLMGISQQWLRKIVSMDMRKVLEIV